MLDATWGGTAGSSSRRPSPCIPARRSAGLGSRAHARGPFAWSVGRCRCQLGRSADGARHDCRRRLRRCHTRRSAEHSRSFAVPTASRVLLDALRRRSDTLEEFSAPALAEAELLTDWCMALAENHPNFAESEAIRLESVAFEQYVRIETDVQGRLEPVDTRADARQQVRAEIDRRAGIVQARPEMDAAEQTPSDQDS